MSPYIGQMVHVYYGSTERAPVAAIITAIPSDFPRNHCCLTLITPVNTFSKVLPYSEEKKMGHWSYIPMTHRKEKEIPEEEKQSPEKDARNREAQKNEVPEVIPENFPGTRKRTKATAADLADIHEYGA